jgi:hypothetical protein
MSQLSSREIARIKASAVALLLNSHVAGDKLQFLHNSKVEQYYYKVPLHSDDFWFRVIFADETYMLKATHRKIAAYSMHGFTLEFNERFSGDEAYSGGGGRLEFLPESGRLGVPFYTGDDHDHLGAAQCLDGLSDLFRALDFSAMQWFLVNPLQAWCVARYSDAGSCARQAQATKNLLFAIHSWARSRHYFGKI